MAVPREPLAMIRRSIAACLLLTLMGLLVGSVHAARSESVEVKDRAGNKHDLLVLSHEVAKFEAQRAAYGVAEAFN